MNTYSSYKDSGIEWIGEIPSEWDSLKLKYIFSEKPITHNTELNCGSISFGRVVFKDNDKVPISTKKSYQEVLEGEYLINPLNLNYDLKSLRIGLSDIDVVVSSGYIVIKNRIEISKSYYKWLLHIYDILHMKLLGSGVRQTISFNHISNSILTYPPLHEQQQISDYLDYKTLKIDTLIEKTQQKIELLKEQRTSLINTTVTKGLDPNVEMKDSGVEWIGKIPSEWNTISLRYYLIRVGSGSTPRGGGDVYSDNGIPFLRSQNVHFDGLHLEGVVFISEEIHQNMNNTIVKHGDVLLNITGGSIGRSCVVDTHEEMNVNQHVSILRTKESLINFYLNYCLVSSIGQEQVDYNQTGGNREGLSSDNIKNFKFVLPPLQEQQQIVDYINKKTSKIDKLVDIESKRIILLKEYRQSLISDVVTGKVDVRDEVLV